VWGGTVTHMNLINELLKCIWDESGKGWRSLEPHETRYSGGPYCSHKLFWEKIHAVPDPRTLPPPVRVAATTSSGVEIYKVSGAAALSGTFAHTGFEDFLAPVIESAEKRTDKKGKTTKMSGHIDMIYDSDEHGRVVCDIKTLSTYIFDYVVGLKVTKEQDSYSNKKRIGSIQQANGYAMSQDVEWFCILWVNRDSWLVALEWFKVDPNLQRAIDIKLENVERARVAYLAGNKLARPRLLGVCECTYCRHSAEYDDYDKSPVACKGEAAIRQAEKLKPLGGNIIDR